MTVRAEASVARWITPRKNRLEDYAKPVLAPLILGRFAGQLDAEAQAVILTWAIKGAMVFEHTTRKKALRFYTQDERVRFAGSSSFAPPDGAYVWLAQYRGRRATHSTIQNILLGPKRGSGSHHIQVITITVRHFVFQVVAGRWPKWHRLDIDQIDASIWNRPTLRLWPSLGQPIRWPPKEHLSDQTLKSFTDRFSTGVPLTDA